MSPRTNIAALGLALVVGSIALGCSSSELNPATHRNRNAAADADAGVVE